MRSSVEDRGRRALSLTAAGVDSPDGPFLRRWSMITVAIAAILGFLHAPASAAEASSRPFAAPIAATQRPLTRAGKPTAAHDRTASAEVGAVISKAAVHNAAASAELRVGPLPVASAAGTPVSTQSGANRLSAASQPAPASPPAAPEAGRRGPCPVARAKPCVIELQGPRAPSASPECTGEPWRQFIRFMLPGKWADANKDGWWESVLGISLDPATDCGCAHISVHYGAGSQGFSLNVGDSPTNDGFGGDAGTTFDAAEVQIQGQKLTVYSGEGPGKRAAPISRLYDMDLPPLAGRSIRLDVCDQTLGFTLDQGRGTTPIQWTLQTMNERLLFSLSPRTRSEEAEARSPQDHKIYAAFNRVIHTADGAPSHGRIGSGIKRVELTLTP